jgi:hypothetical protein
MVDRATRSQPTVHRVAGGLATVGGARRSQPNVGGAAGGLPSAATRSKPTVHGAAGGLPSVGEASGGFLLHARQQAASLL